MQHDPAGTCSPGGSLGNFIMFPQATDGALENNRRFSTCSRDSIRAVLESKAEDCFTREYELVGVHVVVVCVMSGVGVHVVVVCVMS